MRRQVCAFCVAVLVTAAAWTAVAGDKEEAKQLFDAGLKLMHLDDFAGASADFERSVALYPTQNSLFNLANCYKALQRYGDALAAIERLRKDFAGKLKPEIKDAVERQQQEINSLVARLTLQTVPADATIRIDGKDMGTGPKLGPLLLGPGEHEIEAARSGYRSQRRSVKLVSGAGRTEKFVLEGASGNLVVRANVAGAAVFVDGRQVGTTPLDEPLALPPGEYVLNLRAAGHEDAERSIEVQSDSKQVLDIVLAPKTAAPSSAASGATPASEISLSTSEPAKPKSRALRVVTWASLAGAVAAGIVAGTFWIISTSQYGDFKTARNTYADTPLPANYEKANNAAADVRRSGNIAIGCGIGAGVLAVTALVTYLLDSDGEESKSKTSVSVSPFGLGVKF
ncbi:MAG TPA: PEGA domain-containing protein [Polyangia bacterium]|jgi:PEGA domain.|nr:PEGA domain-containing protein [Polyangia bacterium]